MTAVIDAHLKWERELREISTGVQAYTMPKNGAGCRPEAKRYSPSLVSLKRSGDPAKFGVTIDALLDLAAEGCFPSILIDQTEREMFRIIKFVENSASSDDGEDGPDAGVQEHAILYRPEDSKPDEFPELFTEIKRGPPVIVRDRDRFEGRGLPQDRNRKTDSRGGFIGVIDDGIPFLNRAFADANETRILATWLQASDSPSTKPGTGIGVGRVLTNNDINPLLGGDEATQYRRINDEIYRPTDLKAVVNAVSHGSHIMSIAAGGLAAMRQSKDEHSLRDADHILAVQLEPQTVLDTSARRLGFAVVHGIRWMMAQAIFKSFDESYGYLPLVVNVSYGAAAGPKDGSGFFETAVRAEVKRFERWTHILFGTPSPLRVVLPFGNGYRDKLGAFATASTKQPMALDWRILPDDRTASYLEIRIAQGAKGCLTLKPPCGSGLHDVALEIGQNEAWVQDHQVLATIFREPDGKDGQAVYVIATRPTSMPGSAARPAPAGGWEVEVKVDCEALVTMQVQRDDTPFSYRPNGRQSYLDHPEAHDWDAELRNYSEPSLSGPVTRKFSHISFASPETPGVYDEGILWAGGVYRHHYKQDCPPIARYSAAGSDNIGGMTAIRPTVSFPTETSHGLPGMLGLGTRTGSVAALGGTSVAAPQLARQLLNVLVDSGPFADICAEIDVITGGGDDCPDEGGRRGVATLEAVATIPRGARDR